MKLTSKSRPFVPKIGRVEEKTGENNKIEEVKQEKENLKIDEDLGDPGILFINCIINKILGAIRSHNPFTDALNNFEYREPDEKELEESKRIADEYFAEEENRQKKWLYSEEK